MTDVRISELPATTEVTGREIFVCARDSENWGVLLEQIRGRLIFPEDHGAAGDGESDDREALLAAAKAATATGRPLVLAGSTYRIASDLHIEVPIHFLGGRLSIDPDVAVAVTGRISAPAEQIFLGRITGPLDATEVVPEWFGATGAPYGAQEPPDDTAAVQAAIDAAGGGVLRLSALYWVKPGQVTFRTANAGLHVIGHSGAAMKGPGGGKGQHRLSRPCGLALLEDGDWMVRFGSTQKGERGCNQIVVQDVIFDGNHHKCHLGLVWAQAVSQAKFDRVAVRNTRGPGLFANKLEDVNITNAQFGKLGDVANKWGYRGGIVFGAPPKSAGIGSNVVFFHACRFEWFDGGYFRVAPEPVTEPDYRFNNNALPYVHHLILNQCKIEVGDIGEDGEVYGKTRGQWAVFEFGAARNGARENDRPRWVNNIQVNGCHFNGLHHARTFVRAGDVESFAVRGNNFTFSKSVQNPQSLFELTDDDGNEVDCKTFVFKDNQSWVKGGAGGLEFTYVDRSRYQVHFEPPLTAKLKG